MPPSLPQPPWQLRPKSRPLPRAPRAPRTLPLPQSGDPERLSCERRALPTGCRRGRTESPGPSTSGAPCWLTKKKKSCRTANALPSLQPCSAETAFCWEMSTGLPRGGLSRCGWRWAHSRRFARVRCAAAAAAVAAANHTGQTLRETTRPAYGRGLTSETRGACVCADQGPRGTAPDDSRHRLSTPRTGKQPRGPSTRRAPTSTTHAVSEARFLLGCRG